MPSPTPVNRRSLLTLLGGSIAAPLLVARIRLAHREAWPTRARCATSTAFRLGGATDSLSRILCQKMSELFRTVVRGREPGRGGRRAGRGCGGGSRRRTDTRWALAASPATCLRSEAMPSFPTTRVRDFTFIGGMWQLPNILTGETGPVLLRPQGIAGRLQEGAAQIHLRFGRLRHHVASLSGEMMNSMAGVEVVHIPYKGAGPALNDLLGGRVDMLFDNLPGSLPSVRAGLIKPVAVTSRTRIPELPDVAAMAEVLPGYAITSWTAMIGPASMPADLVAQINALAAQALADPLVKTRYGDLGASTWPTSPAEIAAFRDSEQARLLPVMQAAGIKPE